MVKAIEGKGGKAVAVKADVSKLEDVTALFKQAAEAFPDEKIEVGHNRKQGCIPSKRSTACSLYTSFRLHWRGLSATANECATLVTCVG